MSSPAPHIRHGGPQQNGEVTGRASPGGSVRAAADDRLQKSRSMLVVIGALLLVVLVVGGSAGVLSITMGYVVPYTAAIVAVVASVAVVLVGMIGAVVAIRKAYVPAAEEPPRAGVESAGPPIPEQHPAGQPPGEWFWSAPPDVQQGPSQKAEPQAPEVFTRIASRLQAKVSRAFVDLDALERRIEDPELLATVFSLDHLVTRIRREVENLAVLGGDTPQARSGQPAEVNQVLRLAVASTEDYQRITTLPLRGIKIHGHVVAELINILAELLDNATSFTPPQAPKITVTATRVAAGLAIEVHDRGIGMPPDDVERVNRLLAGYTDVDLHQLLGEGRIGFAVVNRLAPRHNIRVQLRTNIFGGIDAAVVVPHNLLSEPEEAYGAAAHVHSASMMRPELATSRPPSFAMAAAPHPHPQPAPSSGEWPWPASGDPAESPTDVPANGRHSRPGAAAGPGAVTPSPFPRLRVRESGDMEEELGTGRDSTGDSAPTGPTPVTPQMERPPLPKRGGATYLRPELREPPRVARVSPGHDPDLLVDVIRGREHAELEDSDGGQ